MKKYLVLVLAVLMIGALATGALAGKHGPAGKSNVEHLYLYEKWAHAGWDWEILDGGAWGKMTFRTAGPEFWFVFNGHGLEPNTDYSLIYYADPWPGDNPGALIASGTSNRGGNLHLAGSIDLGIDLPDSADANYPGGAKIWLIPSAYYDSTGCAVTGWPGPYNADPGVPSWQAAPAGWLFEHNLITYHDTDV